MNKFLGMMIISSFVLLNACVSSASTLENPLEGYTEETLTVLFSDSSTLQNENGYYEALLELQRTYLADTPSFIIIDATEREIIRYYKIEEFPTMLVLTGEQENLRIEGAHSKDEILAHLIEIYHLEKEAILPVNRILS